jgi:hypothetical protein
MFVYICDYLSDVKSTLETLGAASLRRAAFQKPKPPIDYETSAHLLSFLISLLGTLLDSPTMPMVPSLKSFDLPRSSMVD